MGDNKDSHQQRRNPAHDIPGCLVGIDPCQIVDKRNNAGGRVALENFVVSANRRDDRGGSGVGCGEFFLFKLSALLR